MSFIKQKNSQEFFIERLIKLELELEELDKQDEIDPSRRNGLVKTIKLYSDLIDERVKIFE